MHVRITTPRFRALFAPPGDKPAFAVAPDTETAPLEISSAPRLHGDAEEAHWLLRARQGDVAAFEWLMNRYRERAVRLAVHILRRPADAEDVVQEAFVRAFAQIRGFRGDAAFYSWLYTIVTRLCLNRMRQPQWHREWGRGEDDWTQADTDSADDAEQHTNRLQIETLLDRLSPPLRAALVLRELEGMDYDEIAAALNIPVGTVRSRLNAARQQFRALWERAMKEAADV